ncbi:sigmaY antisigma factor component [Paenibacillus koleovorans]|uniref:sigmaY antisigma factor component n=1 Tax=Paenibacillus koleovorans TaxID=121608 RepID=UPI000FD9DC4A|nr:sigmaY antisigma factor component [Paenibacillus koleovorans]
MNATIDGVPIWLLALIPFLLLGQGTWLFTDARRRNTYPWFWGIWGLIQFPLPILFYLWLVRRKKKSA